MNCFDIIGPKQANVIGKSKPFQSETAETKLIQEECSGIVLAVESIPSICLSEKVGTKDYGGILF
jgi:hypothetical protein